MVQTEKEIKEYEEMNKKKKRNLILLPAVHRTKQMP